MSIPIFCNPLWKRLPKQEKHAARVPDRAAGKSEKTVNSCQLPCNCKGNVLKCNQFVTFSRGKSRRESGLPLWAFAAQHYTLEMRGNYP